MIIKFIKTMAGPGGAYTPGQTAVFEDRMAKELIDQGTAIGIVPQVMETQMLEQPETTARRTRKKTK